MQAEQASPSDMTTIEIVQELEAASGKIEAERVREREARQQYKAIVDDVEAAITEIRNLAAVLVREQRRRLDSFGGLVGEKPTHAHPGGRAAGKAGGRRRGQKGTLAEAILTVQYPEPLSTDEILAALGEAGFASNATDRSLKSSLNQALARLCRDGKVTRYRLDGEPIPEHDTRSRARRYMPAGNGAVA